MAIDSREKRQSIVAISLYSMGPSVTANAGQDQEWRQEAGYSYSGILAGGVPAPPVVTNQVLISYGHHVAARGAKSYSVGQANKFYTLLGLKKWKIEPILT